MASFGCGYAALLGGKALEGPPATTIASAVRPLRHTQLGSCAPRFVAALVLALVCASCQSFGSVSSRECLIEGPLRLAPRKLGQLHLGLSKTSVDGIMGPPSQSPAPGQYYYFTGGQCPLGDPAGKLFAPCGLVAQFAVETGHDSAHVVAAGGLQRCWWGAVVLGMSRDLGSDEPG